MHILQWKHVKDGHAPMRGPCYLASRQVRAPSVSYVAELKAPLAHAIYNDSMFKKEGCASMRNPS